MLYVLNTTQTFFDSLKESLRICMVGYDSNGVYLYASYALKMQDAS